MKITGIYLPKKRTTMITRLFSLFAALASVATSTFAQVNLGGFSYTQNFDNIGSGLPAGWTVVTGASPTSSGTSQTFDVNATSWGTSTGGFRNVAAAEAPLPADAAVTVQTASTDRALGLRQTTSFADLASALPAFMVQLSNTAGITDFTLNFKLMQCHQTATGGRTVNWQVEYAVGAAPTSWLSVPTTPASLSTTQGTWGSTLVNVNFGNVLDNHTSPVWIRISAAGVSTGGGTRPHTAIDDFTLSYNNSNICSTPTVQASNITFGTITDNSINLSWENGNGAGRIVVANTSNIFTNPVNGSNPEANTLYSGGQQVVYNGSGAGPITVTGLTHSTMYWFRIYEFCEPDRMYQTAEAFYNAAAAETEVCVAPNGTATINACGPYTWIDGNTYTENDNTATYLLTTSAGCDSLVTLNLTIFNFSPEISLNQTTLTAQPTGASYQWVNCNNDFAPIPGATNPSFTPTVSGNYAVIVTLNGCSELSNCQQVQIASSLDKFNEKQLTVYPNPTASDFRIEGLTNGDSIRITNTQGQVVFASDSVGTNQNVSLAEHSKGLYLLQVLFKDGSTSVAKLVLK